jgi:diguanylate cyclase (GGDEF)-like protein
MMELHADGSWRVIEATANNLLDDPSVRGIVINSRDATERKAFEEQLSHQAFHDPLTDLPNRALFTDRLGHALARADRHPESVAILFLDLDNFKVINDSLGHKAGDELLVSTAERLRRCLRPGDTVARLSGDEFTVLLEDMPDRREAIRLAERIARRMGEPFVLKGREAFTTTSIGIAFASSAADQPDDLLRKADIAMYRAKSQGKAGYMVFDPGMDAEVHSRLRMESDLRRAVERDEFVLHYQVKVELDANVQFAGSPAVATGEGMPRVVDVEALAASRSRPSGACGVHSSGGRDRPHHSNGTPDPRESLQADSPVAAIIRHVTPDRVRKPLGTTVPESRAGRRGR